MFCAIGSTLFPIADAQAQKLKYCVDPHVTPRVSRCYGLIYMIGMYGLL